ncbi:MAG TPA: GWxTD domain-containing protein, partial [Bacteroidota bacterium]|nr:GWxTD domain-containing protein [Bacteroidota bacterium]
MTRSARLCLVIILCAGGAPAPAQVEMPQSAPQDFSATLFVDPVAFQGRTPGEARLDVFVRVGYDNLSFVKTGDAYNASYEMTITVDDSAGAHVLEKTWTEHVDGVSFDQSVSSSAFSLQQRSVPVAPGRYVVRVSVRDLESKSEKRASYDCVVPDMATPLIAMSDLLLVSRISVHDGKKSLMPNVSPNVGNLANAFYLFFELYNRAGPDSLHFEARVADAKGELVARSDTGQTVTPGKNEVFMRVDNSTLPLGDYVLQVLALPASDTARAIASRVRRIMVRWNGLPRSMKDLDIAIEQLEYIAKDNEISDLKAATTLEEKQKKFLDFWKRRSTNPNAARNEKMALYYARVDYANKHFTRYREGWRTDMGLVFILLGPPSNVERYPFQIDQKPEEVWQYYDLNYQFVFRDENGFGDYRL